MTRLVGRVVIAVSLAAFVLTACGGSDTAVLETVDAGAFADLVAADGTVILDIRTPEEYAEGHIEGSLNIDFYEEDFAAQIGQLDRDVEYAVYCRSGNRSGQAMELFADLEFNAVHELGGGIVAWIGAGLELATG
jgi:rhodanese-related sulfurtransferase